MTKIDSKAEAALRDPTSRVVQFEMTPERRERFGRLSSQIVDLLKANTESPGEAYMLLHTIVEGFEACFGIRGGITVTTDEKGNQG